MKKLTLILSSLFAVFIVGCDSTTSTNTELMKAESLMGRFSCSITSVAEDADAMDNFNFNAMQNDKDKVNTWLANYKNGQHEFNSPISEVIQSQLEVYTSSCESLGGHLVN